ncbi:MAG TPA: histidine--tRNA ligase [Polyangiaceae bacterium]|nr:histidine--tRNA ligase [Polyangiaceae bacterium]
MIPPRAVKGMNDVLPDEIGRWQHIERAYARTMSLHGYREVRTPYVEETSLFVRAMGDATDVVEKEMYSFEHHGDGLTLRPEGTAGAVRAYLEHAVQGREPVTRWWYAGPMFRAENTQRGRYRQFSQLGAEIFGDDGPGCDAEMIAMLVEFLQSLAVPDVQLLVNSLGGPEARSRYRAALVAHLTPRQTSLSPESQRRLATNPLRILDSKDERDREAVRDAPTIREFVDAGDREHFAKLLTYLDALGTPYGVDERLVRGLDYYTSTLFEIKGAHGKLGAGNTLVGGGRYDRLVADLGGPAVPAIGFAAGLERLLIASELSAPASATDALIAPVGDAAIAPGLELARRLRRFGIRCEIDSRGGSLKSQLRRANHLGARMVLILGDSELADGSVQVKDLEAHSQERMPREPALRVVVDRLMAASRSVDPPTRSERP